MQTFIHLDYRELAGIRDKIKLGERGLLPAYRSLLEEADSYLDLKPGSVVDKGTVPPSGDKHDFYSIGKYAWPNPETPDGVPYVRIDGRINPEVTGERYDLKPYFDMRIRVNALALAYFHSGEKRYAGKASELLRVWFLNPETRMNPNFGFASALPGVYDGMPIGIIEGVQLIELLDSVNLLKLSDSWTPADNEGLQCWFSGYTDWLLESAAGQTEFAATDNHGSWYAAQIAAFSIYCGDMGRVKTMMERAKWQLGVQFSPDGSLHRELRRNRSLHYSIYGLCAFAALARCGEVVGEDLWRYRTEDGRGMERGFGFLAPYLAGEKDWTWENIDDGITVMAIPLMRRAATVYGSPELSSASRHLSAQRPLTEWTAWLTSVQQA